MLEHGGIGGLAGNRYIGPEFHVRNRSPHVFVLERAELVTVAGRQLAEFAPGGENVRTVKPGATQRIVLFWDLSGRAEEVLGSKPQS